MKWMVFLAVVPFAACNVSEPDSTPEYYEQDLTGYWFPCLEDKNPAGKCDIVGDEGLTFTMSNQVYRNDGAGSYAHAKHGDTNGIADFDIRAKSLYFFPEHESYDGTYIVKKDSLHLVGHVEEATIAEKASFRIRIEDGVLELKSGDALMGSTHQTRKYRKYAGEPHEVLKPDWLKAMGL